MKFVNDILNFGNSRKGKILSWTLIILATITFFIGIFMGTVIGGGTPQVNRLSLSAPNMVWGTITDVTGDQTGYHLQVTERQTPITVLTEPLDPGVAVVFSSDSPLVSFSATRVPAGGTTVLRLQQHGGMYTFPHQYEPPVRVTVTVAGRPMAVIFVRIQLTTDNISVMASIQRSVPLFPDTWVPAYYVDMRHFDRYSPYRGEVKYRVRLTATIFGQTLFDTETNPEHFRYFDFEELPQFHFRHDVELFNEENDWYITFDDRFRIYLPEVTLNFRIWFNFNGEKHFTNTDLLLNMRRWTLS